MRDLLQEKKSVAMKTQLAVGHDWSGSPVKRRKASKIVLSLAISWYYILMRM